MNKTQQYDKAISLNLPSSLCNEMDDLVRKTGMTRTSFLHQSIHSYVDYMKTVELPILKERQQHYNLIANSKWQIDIAKQRGFV